MMEERKMKRAVVAVVVFFCCLIIGLSVALNVFSSLEQRGIIEDSIKAQLMSISYAARGILDEYGFANYNAPEDVAADEANYIEMRAEIRTLAEASGAEYIYALKMIDGEAMFVVDSDPEDETIFIPYDLSPVHQDAFNGIEGAGVNNVTDAYGTFHSAAIPVYKNGYVVGIVSTDIADEHFNQSVEASRRNIIILIVALVIAMAVMMVFLGVLMKRLRDLQTQLERMAHYDNVTGLPNRQYLFDYLAGLGENGGGQPYALFFIDLDNFKAVNDNAGHDAGDEVLQFVATFLQQQNDKKPVETKSFRPSAGILNVSARVGGDEFIQVVPGVETVEQAAALARQLVEAFDSNAGNRYVEKYNVSMSVGVALYPYHTDNYNVLIKYADIAMYHAKHSGKNDWKVYDDEMDPKPEK